MDITFGKDVVGHWAVSIPNGWQLYRTTQGDVYGRLRDALGNNGIRVMNPMRMSEMPNEGDMELTLSGNIPSDANQRNAIFNTVIGELSTYNPN